MRIASRLVLLLIAVLVGAIVLSPYGSAPGYPYKLIEHTVEIDAPKDTVFHFLGNSANAARWSVFVHHITPLNPGAFADGAVGCRRRCFCNADEKGRQWDELITEREPGRKRQLVIYNMVDFPMNAEGLATEQRYEAIGNGKTRLRFTVFFKTQPSVADQLKLYLAAFQIQGIFARNMDNIKRIVETEHHGARP